MTKFSIMSLATFALFGGGPALAANCAKVSFSPTTVSLPNWDPINPAAVMASFSATIRPDSSASKSVRIIFLDNNDASDPVRLGVNGPIYQLLDNSGNNIVYPKNRSISSTTNPTVTSPKGDMMTVPLRVNVPAKTDNVDYASGSYTEPLNYTVQCFLANGKTNGIDGPFAGPVLKLTIPQLVSLTTASAATIDFQNFTSRTSSISVGVKSTSRVQVNFVTANGGRMVRSGATSPYPLNSYIPYSMSFNNQPLTNGLQLSRAGTAGTTWPLVLDLGTLPQGKIAGAYEDTITLTMTPVN
jgi:hypothetical protein